MSKNQTFSGMPSLKSIPKSKKVSINFIPRLASASNKSFKTYYKSSHPISKNRESSVTHSKSETPINIIFKDCVDRSYFKQTSDSTETNSDRKKEILELEQKVTLLKNNDKPEEKFLDIMEIWSQAVSISSPTSQLFSMLKEEIEETFKTFQSSLNQISSITTNHQETKQTLKILKKRFQKLAFENLELANQVKEKENSLFRAKSKIKSLREKSESDLKAKTSQIQQLQSELESYKSETKDLQKLNFSMRFQVKSLKALKSKIQCSEDLDPSKKENLLSVLHKSDKSHIPSISISKDFDDHSLILASTTSNCNSFMSSYDMDI